MGLARSQVGGGRRPQSFRALKYCGWRKANTGRAQLCGGRGDLTPSLLFSFLGSPIGLGLLQPRPCALGGRAKGAGHGADTRHGVRGEENGKMLPWWPEHVVLLKEKKCLLIGDAVRSRRSGYWQGREAGRRQATQAKFLSPALALHPRPAPSLGVGADPPGHQGRLVGEWGLCGLPAPGFSESGRAAGGSSGWKRTAEGS